jgi:outer membrane immunogenic protein
VGTDPSSWTGCYVGGNVGYGRAQASDQYTVYESSPEIDTPVTNSYHNEGFIGGGQAGCQLQTGSFLWGLEGDWSSFRNSDSRAYNIITNYYDPSLYYTANGTYNLTSSMSSLWSVRARFGIIASDVYHLYVTAGIAGAEGSYSYSAVYTGKYTGGNCSQSYSYCAAASANVGMSAIGGVFGAGVEWKISPQFVVGAEYLHYLFTSSTALGSNQNYIGTPPLAANFLTGPGPGDHYEMGNVDVFRLRASYLFNWGH